MTAGNETTGTAGEGAPAASSGHAFKHLSRACFPSLTSGGGRGPLCSFIWADEAALKTRRCDLYIFSVVTLSPPIMLCLTEKANAENESNARCIIVCNVCTSLWCDAVMTFVQTHCVRAFFLGAVWLGELLDLEHLGPAHPKIEKAQWLVWVLLSLLRVCQRVAFAFTFQHLIL